MMADAIAGIEAQLSSNDAGLEAGFAKARTAMAAIENQIRQLTAEEKKGAISTADYARQMLELETAHERLSTAMAGAAGRTNSLDTAMNSVAAQGSKNMGRSVLLASQGIEDLQYGFSAVLNNIPMLVMSLGGAAGLAGTISLVGVGINVLVNNETPR